MTKKELIEKISDFFYTQTPVVSKKGRAILNDPENSKKLAKALIEIRAKRNFAVKRQRPKTRVSSAKRNFVKQKDVNIFFEERWKNNTKTKEGYIIVKPSDYDDIVEFAKIQAD